jgi:hypothetical protein
VKEEQNRPEDDQGHEEPQHLQRKPPRVDPTPRCHDMGKKQGEDDCGDDPDLAA